MHLEGVKHLNCANCVIMWKVITNVASFENCTTEAGR